MGKSDISVAEKKARISFLCNIFQNLSKKTAINVLNTVDYDVKRTIELLITQKFVLFSQLSVSDLLFSSIQKSVSFENVSQANIINGKRKALLIGISYVGSDKYLPGCYNDINRTKSVLTTLFGFSNSNVLTHELSDFDKTKYLSPTKENIIKEFGWLVDNAEPGDVLFLQYSGHGLQKALHPFMSNEKYQAILPSDYVTKGILSDEELYANLVKKLPKSVKLVCFFDCCHSESILGLPYIYQNNKWIHRKKPWQTNNDADVIVFSSCLSSQNAADISIPNWGSGGAVSLAICTFLTQNPHTMKLFDLLRKTEIFLQDRTFNQKPNISSNKPINLKETQLPIQITIRKVQELHTMV